MKNIQNIAMEFSNDDQTNSSKPSKTKETLKLKMIRELLSQQLDEIES